MQLTISDYRYQTHPAVGRNALIERLIRDLGTRHLNLAGPRSTGKSCVARALQLDPRLAEQFQAVIYCDIKSRSPDGDEEFFHYLKEELFQQLPDSLSKILLDPSENVDTEEALAESAEAWEEAGSRVLIILDGIDDAFLSLEDGWDFLCGFVDKRSVRVLATSRRRIRLLANSRKKVGSNMHERFKSPTELPPLDRSDIQSIVELAGGEVSDALVSVLVDWTGGHAGLLVALCDEAMRSEREVLTMESINGAGKQMVAERNEALEIAWDDLQPEERNLIITSARLGAAPVEGGDGARLQKLGFATVAHGKLTLNARLINDFASGAGDTEALFRDWFGTEVSYLSSMKQVLSLRLGPRQDDEAPIVQNVRDGIEAIERPDKASRVFRDIVKEALELIWDAEIPDREVPPFTNGGGPNWLVWDHSWPRNNEGFQNMLDLMTHDKFWVSPPKRLNRKVFAMVSFLIHAGDFKNHQNQQVMTPGFLVSSLVTAVELVTEMKQSGLVQ
jgi:hypothetical protein